MDPTRAAGSVRPTRSPRDSGKLSLRGPAPSLNVEQNLSYSFGDRNGPQTPQAAIPAGAFASPEASPVPSPTGATEVSLSAISSLKNPVYGFAADPQKLAASWVTDQHYGEAAHQVRNPQTTLLWLWGSPQFRAHASLQKIRHDLLCPQLQGCQHYAFLRRHQLFCRRCACLVPKHLFFVSSS